MIMDCLLHCSLNLFSTRKVLGRATRFVTGVEALILTTQVCPWNSSIGSWYLVRNGES